MSVVEPRVDPRRLRRTVQRVLLGGTVCAVLYAVVRFSIVSLPVGFDGMAPTLPQDGARLLVDRYPAWARPLGRLDIVVYRVEGHGQLVGRIRAVPGDTLGRDGEVLTINGERTAFAPGVLPMGAVPEGRYLVLNENATSALADGRRLGLTSTGQLTGRMIIVLMRLPV